MKNITILGSTGSIGRQAIEVINKYQPDFNVIGLSANTGIEILQEQIKQVNPKIVTVADERKAKELRNIINIDIEILSGSKNLKTLASLDENDIVLNALVGAVGLESTIEAINKEKTLALANKESMVAGGELINKILKEKDSEIIPVDSEHSAIFQCLIGEEKENIKKIILTGSGGPFRGRPKESFAKAGIKEALSHPRWSMGKKITVDSATLMNKGLEVIEAHYLFKIDYSKIDVIIHPQSIIHSFVLFKDGSLKAQLGPTNMKIPIQYGLTYPKRVDSFVRDIDLKEMVFEFEEPDWCNFPCLKIAYDMGKKGKTYPAVLNAANEEAVFAFLEEKINFGMIPYIIEKTLEKHKPVDIKDIEDILNADRLARIKAKEIIKELN
ncbi:MAG: 1-deoxy-D-xylulose-5-phosphate reductoisomerase [Actinomycetia bacterium]|nr:1-deoxy-D-xylulose-5-phosphate reductoisomerase [Actinomycetes bacterium]